MSLDIVAVYKDGTRDRHPVASTYTFKTYWETPARELNLTTITWMYMLQIDDYEVIEQLASELKILKQKTVDNTELDEDVRDHVNQRISATLQVIENALQNWENLDHISCG